jgi:hypothetical protein
MIAKAAAVTLSWLPAVLGGSQFRYSDLDDFEACVLAAS